MPRKPSHLRKPNRARGRPSPHRGKGRNAAWIFAHIGHQGDECLIWPFGKTDTGYGQLGHLGRLHKAHRFMCEAAHGPPPSPTHEAAHNCGNGMGGCVHPGHLEWKTPSENQLDRRRHGTAVTSVHGATGKLTKAQRKEIIELKGIKTQREIAAIYGISFETVSRWQRTDPNREQKYFPFDREEDDKLRAAVAKGMSNKDIADLMGRDVVSVAARKHRLRKRGLLEQGIPSR